MSMWEKIIKLGSAAVGMLTGFFGGWTLGSRVLVTLMVTDYVLGCACALTGHSTKTETGHFLSRVAFMGLLRKAVIFAVILLAAMVDKVIGGIGETTGATMFRSAAEFFYIASEGMSTVENAGLLGVPVPSGLRQALEALRENTKDPPNAGGDGEH